MYGVHSEIRRHSIIRDATLAKQRSDVRLFAPPYIFTDVTPWSHRELFTLLI